MMRCQKNHPAVQHSAPSVAGGRQLHRLQSNKPPSGQPDRAQAQEQHVHTPCSQISRRQQLLGLLASPVGLAAAGPAHAASPDILEGTQNWASIGLQAYGLWAQSLFDSISNDDQTGLTAAMTDDQTQRHSKRFGSISVPGLSSFSFLHGTLVGGLLILLLAADKLSPGQQGSSQQQQQQQAPPLQQVQPSLAEQPVVSSLNPEVEASLRRLLAQPDVASTFHDPAVQAALAEVRRDVRTITAYKNNAAVMQAFEKLLEIEDILERL